MAEVVVALAVIALVIALGWVPAWPLLLVGAAFTGVGVLASLPVGLAYHRRLQLAAARLGILQKGWWWAPTRLHEGLDPAGREEVLPMFRLGVVAVAVAFVGMFLVAVAAAKAYLLLGL